jgi:cyclin A
MREILVDWLVDVQQQFQLSVDTLYLAVSILDRSMSCMTVRKRELQLLGCCSMLIAAKYEEVYNPSAADFSYISDYTYSVRQIVDMETKILMCLDYKLTRPVPTTYMNRFLAAAEATARESEICKVRLGNCHSLV